jgi:hypothetical protein
MEEKMHPLAAAYLESAGSLPQMVTEVQKPRTMANNKQMFDQNELRNADVSKGMYEQNKGLYNDRPPNFAIETERPEHRMLVYLKAQGLTNQECAERMSYSYGWVCQIVRQPWFRERFIAECELAGRDAVETFLQAEVMPSLQTLSSIRDDKNAKEATRVAAANSLLDRFLGKPTQRVETENASKGLDDARATVEDLERQVKSLRAQNGIHEDSQPLS